jgi:hypothetical protein
VIRGGTLSLSQTIASARWAQFTGLTSSAASTGLSVLDWNGDGKGEVVVGDAQAQRVFVLFGHDNLAGSAALIDRAGWIIKGEKPNDQFGFAVSGGDLDADGSIDLMLSARAHLVDDHPAHFDDAGAVYVLYGGGTRGPLLPEKIYLPMVLRNH